MTDPRDLSALDRFCARVREKLRANDHKGHWAACTPDWLLGCLRDEVRELVDEVKAPGDITPERAERITLECCDVAAFAMMLSDVVGGLPVDPKRTATVTLTRGPVIAELEDARRDAERAWRRVALLESRIAGAAAALAGHATKLPAPDVSATSEAAAHPPALGRPVVSAGVGAGSADGRSVYAPEPDGGGV